MYIPYILKKIHNINEMSNENLHSLTDIKSFRK